MSTLLLLLLSLFVPAGGLVKSPGTQIATLLSNDTLAYLAAPPAGPWPRLAVHAFGGGDTTVLENNDTLAYLAAPPAGPWPNDKLAYLAAPPAGPWPWTSGGAKLNPEYWLSLLGMPPESELAPDGELPQTKRAEEGGHAHQSRWALWQCVVGAALVVLVLAVAHLVTCCTLGWPRQDGPVSSGEQPQRAPASSGAARKAEAAKSRLESYYSWKPRSDKKIGSSQSLASSGLLSASWLASDASMLGGACLATTLCPQLVVPGDCTLQCALPRVVCRRRQNRVVSINSLASPSETVLLQARLAEGNSADFSGAGIHLELLGGEEELAFLSTEDVWASKGARQPEMEIRRVSGKTYATIKKTDPSTYVMACGTSTLMVFTGQFSKYELQVCCPSGQTVARVSPGSTEGMYEVVVYTNTDAGLVILGLLGINKVEVEPTQSSGRT